MREAHLGELFEDGAAPLELGGCAFDDFLVAHPIAPLHQPEPVLVLKIFLEFDRRRLAIQLQGFPAGFYEPRIVTVEHPVAGIDGHLHLVQRIGEVVAMLDARRMGDDQRGSLMGGGLVEGLQQLGVAGPEGNRGDIDVAIADRHQAQILLRRRFAACGELGDRPHRRRF